MGTAGGQPTVAAASTRPSLSATGSVSIGESMASLGEHTRRPGRNRGGCSKIGAFAGMDSRVYVSRSSSDWVFSGVSISTRKSGSANSQTMFCLPRIVDNSLPV